MSVGMKVKSYQLFEVCIEGKDRTEVEKQAAKMKEIGFECSEIQKEIDNNNPEIVSYWIMATKKERRYPHSLVNAVEEGNEAQSSHLSTKERIKSELQEVNC